MSAPLRVLLVTDAFPPVCGGSGWSTFELARGLRARGHHVEVVKVGTTRGHGSRRNDVSKACRSRSSAAAPRNIPFVRNIEKNERLWSRARPVSRQDRLARRGFDLVHAPARDDDRAGDRRRRATPASRRSRRCATTGRCATGPT